MVPILSIVGRSNSGKTTLLEKLVRELAARGRSVGTIKHHYHGPVEVDVPGKDSWRHRQAGARVVVLSAPRTLFVLRETSGELPLEVLAHQTLSDVELILTEGFKSGPMPKIEVNRAAQGLPLLCGPADRLVAVVSDRQIDVAVPRFGLEEVSPLAEFIEAEFLASCRPSTVEVLIGDRRAALDEESQQILARVVRSLVGDRRELDSGPPIEVRIRGGMS